MTNPQSIATLVTRLERARDAYETATSPRRRLACLDRVIAAGIALRERLRELRGWLDRHFPDDDGDERYAANLAKYEAGWDALNAASGAIDDWMARHYEEISAEEFDARHRSGRRASGKAQAPRFAGAGQARQQAQRGPLAVGRAGTGDGGDAARGDGPALPEFVQSGLV